MALFAKRDQKKIFCTFIRIPHTSPDWGCKWIIFRCTSNSLYLKILYYFFKLNFLEVRSPICTLKLDLSLSLSVSPNRTSTHAHPSSYRLSASKLTVAPLVALYSSPVSSPLPLRTLYLHRPTIGKPEKARSTPYHTDPSLAFKAHPSRHGAPIFTLFSWMWLVLICYERKVVLAD